MKKPSYIAIEGCIGVGKTTLSEALAKHTNGSLLLESFEENPFLADFYRDPATHAFKTQIFFLLSRYKQQQNLGQNDLFNQSTISDYFIVKDRIFAELTLKGSELALYHQLYDTLIEEVHTPDLLIYLRAPIEVLMERIERRGRNYEKTIDPSYLKDLTNSYEHYLSKFSACPILTVDTEELDFPGEQHDVNLVIDAITETLHSGKSRHFLKTENRKQPNLF